MKDVIKFCMTKHEDEIRILAKSPLGGQRFELLIRRWEMNNEPLPEETKPDKYVLDLLSYARLIDNTLCPDL